MDTSRHSSSSHRRGSQSDYQRRNATARSDFNYYTSQVQDQITRHFVPRATLCVTIIVVTCLLHMLSESTTLFQELSTLITGVRPRGFTIEQHNWWNDYLYHLSLCVIAPLTGLVLYMVFSAISNKKVRSHRQVPQYQRQTRQSRQSAVFEEVESSPERVVVRRERRSVSKKSGAVARGQSPKKRSVSRSKTTISTSGQTQSKKTPTRVGRASTSKQRTPSKSKKTQQSQKVPLMVRRITDVSPQVEPKQQQKVPLMVRRITDVSPSPQKYQSSR